MTKLITLRYQSKAEFAPRKQKRQGSIKLIGTKAQPTTRTNEGSVSADLLPVLDTMLNTAGRIT